jgi:hypothetical protein
MEIKTILSSTLTRFVCLGNMYFLMDGKTYKYIIENDSIIEIGKNPLVDRYDTIYGFTTVILLNNIFILQSSESVFNANSEINEIINYDLKKSCVLNRYKENILFSGILTKGNFIFSSYTEANKKYYCNYNILDKKKLIIFSNDASSKSQIRKVENSNYILIFESNYNSTIIDIEKSEICYNINLQSYFVSSPHWANGEPMFRQTISKVLFCQTFNTIICFLKPYKIVGINAEKGEVVWEQKFMINTDNFVIDNETGMIYALEAVWDNEKDKRTILYQVINGGNGEIEFERDLYEELNGEAEPFNVHIHFAGFYEDAIYFSLYERGELYKASKFSAIILEKYKHEKAFYGSPEIFNNRLFVAEDDEKMKRMLVFEI